eukprot:1520336-Pleurochrysis_carterae.AAC.1
MPRRPALARPDEEVPRPTPLPSPLPFGYGLTPALLRRRSIRANAYPSLLNMTCLPTLRACTSHSTVVFRRSKRSETTRTPSRKTRRRGVARKSHRPRRHPARGAPAMQGPAHGAGHDATQAQAGCRPKARLRLQRPSAGSA